MKKTFGIWIAVVFCLILLLAACGEKSQEDVVKKLEDKLENMNGYKAEAEMKMNTGPESLKYQLDIWHKKKDFYRVALKNNQDEKGSQIILKNEDGVFVLTPALNKSFKFQRDWPEKTSQPYLFQSLVQDIVKDKDAEFEVSDSAYIFRTKTNYQSNNNLPYQEIHIDKKSYTPKLVKVLDKDKNALVEVKFKNFDTNSSFKDDDFALEKNMTTGTAETTASTNENMGAFTVVLPTETSGSEITEKKQIDLENGQRVVMTFEGEKNFTLIEEKQEVVPTLSSPQEVNGEIVNLGHTIGAISDNSIEWSSNGMDFYLASKDLTKEELIEVAKSVQGKAVK
ncbi:LolA family protein [Virgibacillus ndiopensis]|uniref:LolA family protein n=1 Tax=Virgibacillus ndiopensis TaxID=2004408 RepID=UPI000C08B64F|nr:outer membrane lipoprotein carrier protein LolA [Virgibacillus ndiopensis]